MAQYGQLKAHGVIVDISVATKLIQWFVATARDDFDEQCGQRAFTEVFDKLLALLASICWALIGSLTFLAGDISLK